MLNTTLSSARKFGSKAAALTVLAGASVPAFAQSTNPFEVITEIPRWPFGRLEFLQNKYQPNIVCASDFGIDAKHWQRWKLPRMDF